MNLGESWGFAHRDTLWVFRSLEFPGNRFTRCCQDIKLPRLDEDEVC